MEVDVLELAEEAKKNEEERAQRAQRKNMILVEATDEIEVYEHVEDLQEDFEREAKGLVTKSEEETPTAPEKR